MAALLLAAGCAGSAEVSRGPGSTRQGYADVLAFWTRDGQLMHEVDTALEVGATYKAWEFRSAMVNRKAALFKLPETRREALIESQRADHGRLHEFYVAAATHREQWNDLDRPGSIWRVVLLCDDRTEAEPIHIRRHKKITVETQELFPYTGTFSRGYDIEFSRTLPDGTPVCGPGTRRMSLRFAGPLGTLHLAWDLR
jgi:hypothetical protein